jgi:hypothetical protein
MDIEKYISELLYEHDCVIIPGFGGLVCNYSSARIDSATNRLYPPFKKISFNRNLKDNDGLLAHKITQSEKISYPEAIGFIAAYTEKITKELNANKHFDLKNIGAFYLGEENTILFEQNKTVNYLTEAFGLKIFYSPPIKRDPIERKIEKKLKDKIIVPSKEKKEFVQAKRKISRYLIASAAVLLIALLLWIPLQRGWLSNIDYSNLNFFTAKEKPLYTINPVSKWKKESGSSYSDSLLPPTFFPPLGKGLNNNVLSNDTLQYIRIFPDGKTPIVVRLNDTEDISVKAQKKRKRFHIIGGAFAFPENARRFKEKLIKLGYDAVIIDKKKSRLQFVSYISFSTRKEALASLEKIRQVQNDVWLMENINEK